jgi:hypothetical protein
MDGARSRLTLAHTFRIGSDGEQLPFLRSACPGLDPYHRESAPGNTKSRPSCWHLQDFGCGRQGEMERCTPSVVRRGPQTASVRLHNGTTDGQPHAAALRLGSKERRKDLIHLLRWQPHARVTDRELELTALQVRLHRELSA